MDVLTFELAKEEDLDCVMEIIQAGINTMHERGNFKQWGNGYPSQEFMLEEIQNQHCYLVKTEEGPVATFCLICNGDPGYDTIEGAWLNHEPYAAIHRLAVLVNGQGYGRSCIQWVCNRYKNVRIDTHEANISMQKLISSCGFTYCGIVHQQGTPTRLAYHKICDLTQG